MAARRPFWKWHRWKSIGFCLWPPSTCIWNLKLKFQSKLHLCSGNHVVYRQTDGQTDRRTRWILFFGRGYNDFFVSRDLETWQMTLKNNRAPLLCNFKLCASFQIHWWIQTGVTVWKRPIWVKIDIFFSCVTLKFHGWPWKLIGHLS